MHFLFIFKNRYDSFSLNMNETYIINERFLILFLVKIGGMLSVPYLFLISRDFILFIVIVTYRDFY